MPSTSVRFLTNSEMKERFDFHFLLTTVRLCPQTLLLDRSIWVFKDASITAHPNTSCLRVPQELGCFPSHLIWDHEEGEGEMAPVRMCWVWLEVRWRHDMRGRGLFRAKGEPKQICISERLLSAGQRLLRTRRAWAEDQLSGLWECFQPFVPTASQKPLVQLENHQLLPLLGHRTNTWG